MEKPTRFAVRKHACWIGLCVVVLALAGAWLTYDRFYRIPRGPALPQQPADRAYSEHAAELTARGARMRIENPDAALSLFDEAIVEDPAYHGAYVNKAELLLERKEYRKALVCYDRLNELRPRAAEYYVGGALCLWRLGDSDTANSYLLKALSAYGYRLKDSPVHSRINRSVVLFLLGREAVARRELDNLDEEELDEASRAMIAHFRLAMDEHRDGDPWGIVGLD